MLQAVNSPDLSYAPYGGYSGSSWGAPGNSPNLLAALQGSDSSDAQVSLSALSQLQSASDAFQYAIEQLMPPYALGTSTGTSSNSGVVSVAAQGNAPTGSYNITVNNLAQGQALRSATYGDANSTVIGSGNLTITFGSYDSSSNTFTPNSQSPITVSLNNATLDAAANAINAAGGGVAAQVNSVSGGYALTISGTNTGSNEAFEIQDDNSSLDGLTWDPTNPGGSGLTLTQPVEDASLSVNGSAITSGSNSGISIAPGLVVSLTGTGSSVVSSQPSNSAIQSQAQSLVSAYNTVQSALADLGSNSATEALAGPYASALTAAADNEFNNGSSLYTELSQIGLNVQAGVASSTSAGVQNTIGASSLSLDSGTLSAALASDPTGTQSLFAAAVQSFYNVADSYGGGDGVIQNAIEGYQAADYVDQLLSDQPYQQPLPTVQDLAANQGTQQGLAPLQIERAQQYARAVGPLQQDAYTSSLLSELYSPYLMPMSVLSAFV